MTGGTRLRAREEAVAIAVSQSGCVWFAVLKRAIDITLASVALLFSLPVMLIAGAIITIESRGGFLYRQKRVGAGGTVFHIYKIRTMYSATEDISVFTLIDDPRVTPFGRVLREFKIDELPQLWNVLEGNMSIIGPRPLSLAETRYLVNNLGYDPDHPGLYPNMRPGLIGLEQINRKKKLTYDQRFELNDVYERSFSWVVDLKIFLAATRMCWQLCSATAASAVIEWTFLQNLL